MGCTNEYDARVDGPADSPESVDSLEEMGITINEPATPMTIEEEQVLLASQWKLMWWRFKKHRIAMGSVIVILTFYMVAAFSEFMAVSLPNVQDAQVVECQEQPCRHDREPTNQSAGSRQSSSPFPWPSSMASAGGEALSRWLSLVAVHLTSSTHNLRQDRRFRKPRIGEAPAITGG